jgi:O-antigen ligase
MQALVAIIGAPYRLLAKALLRAWLPLMLLAAFVGWVCISATFSPYRDDGALGIQGLKLAGGVLAGVGFIAAAGAGTRDRTWIRRAATWSAAAFITLIGIEALVDLPFNRFFNDHPNAGVLARNPAKGASVLMALVWAPIGAMIGGTAREQLGWKLLALGSLVLGFQFDQNANAVGWVCGAIAFAFAYAMPRIGPVLVSAAVAGWLLVAPLATNLIIHRASGIESIPESWRMRLMIWNHAIERIWEKPILGWGVDAARTFEARGRIGDNDFALSPLHSHSFSLQVWLETGLIGVALLGAALIAGGFYVRRALGRYREASAALCGGFIAAFAIWNVSYGAWQEWFVTVPFLIGGLAAATKMEPPPPADPLTFDP